MSSISSQDAFLPLTPASQALLDQRNQQLAAITRTWDALWLTPDLDALLTTIAQAAHDTLGFGVVVLNVVDHAQQAVTVRAHAGLNTAALTALDGASYPWSVFAQLLDARYRHGRCYFIPAGELNWAQSLGDAVYIPPQVTPTGDDNQWQAEDALFVAIEQRDGQVAGIISVDAPRDLRRPTPETLQVLDIFSAQAAIALENAHMYTQVLDAHRATLRQLATPLIPLTEQTVLLPLVGAVDALRAAHMREDVLANLIARRATTLILDLTAVPTLDGPAATELVRTIEAAQLLGAHVLLTGVHPMLAQALHTSGAALDRVRTYGTLQQGVAVALGMAAPRSPRA